MQSKSITSQLSDEGIFKLLFTYTGIDSIAAGHCDEVTEITIASSTFFGMSAFWIESQMYCQSSLSLIFSKTYKDCSSIARNIHVGQLLQKRTTANKIISSHKSSA